MSGSSTNRGSGRTALLARTLLVKVVMYHPPCGDVRRAGGAATLPARCVFNFGSRRSCEHLDDLTVHHLDGGVETMWLGRMWTFNGDAPIDGARRRERARLEYSHFFTARQR